MGDGIAQSAIDATGIAAGLEGCAFALRRCRSRHPAPDGVAPSPTSRKRPSGDTKTFKPLVEARKGFDSFSNTLNTTWQSRRNASPSSRTVGCPHSGLRQLGRLGPPSCGAAIWRGSFAASSRYGRLSHDRFWRYSLSNRLASCSALNLAQCLSFNLG